MGRCVELFAGAGGASVGLRAAGFQSVLQAEWNADACATLRAAGFTDVVEGDVRDVAFDGLGAVDLLWASPPCQGFSNLGKKSGAFDDRNGWPWTWDAIDRMRAAGTHPTWVLCENVLGLLLHDTACDRSGAQECRGCYWEHVVGEFERRFASVSWRVLDAADYGVPQHRKRVFLAAGPTDFPWPAPTHSRAALAHAKWASGEYWVRHGIPADPAGPSREESAVLVYAKPETLPWATVRDATGLTRAVRVETATAKARTVDDVSPTVTTRGTLYTNPTPGEVCRKETRVRAMRAAEVSAPDEDDWMSVLESLAEGRVASSAGERRQLTPVELAALQAFPPGYPFQGSGPSQFKQVGNAVPPLLAEALGRAVIRALGPSTG